MKFRSKWRAFNATMPFGAGATLTGAANLAIAVLSIVTGVVSARLLGPHGRGELAAIQTAPGFIAALAMIGMPEALTYFSAQEPLRAGRYLATASAIALAACPPFMAAGFVAMPILLHAQRPQIVSVARWCLLIAPIWAVASMPMPALRGLGAFAQWNALRVMVLFSIIAVLAAAWVTGNVTATFIAYGWLVYSALLFLPAFWFVLRRSVHVSFLPDSASAGQMFRYGAPCMMTALPQMLNLRLDQMLMAALVPPRDLGLYVVAVAWSGAVGLIVNAVGTVMLPSVASAADREHAVRRLGAGTRATSLMAGLISVSVMASAPLAIVFLFGAPYRGAIPSALVLAPAAGVLGINFTLQEGLRGLGRPYLVLRAEVIGLVVTAIALPAMLPALGIFGAALASMGGYVAVMVALLAGARSAVGASPAMLLVPHWHELSEGLRRLRALAHSLAPSTG